MKVCTNAYTIAKKNSYSSMMTNSMRIRIPSLTDSILRTKAEFDGDFTEESYSLVTTAWEDRMGDFLKGRRIRVEVADAVPPGGDRETVVEGRILEVMVEKDPFRICVYDKEGTLLHADIVDLAYIEDSSHRRIRISEISSEDYLYDFGEKSDNLNKVQKFTSMSPKDATGYNPEETDSLYKHIPFYIKLNRGTRGAMEYFYHNIYKCDFDIGRGKSDYQKPHSRYRAGDGDIDLFLIADPSVRQVMKCYTDLTGESAMLPRCALGHPGSFIYYPELDNDCGDAILDFIDTIREEKIPVGGFQLSSGYCTVETDKGAKCCVFT